ncbi:dihydrofolate reductase [Caminicella sporogenes]|uniref:dihydrofolate reductase n=1 Tax=Caminicella sporogenes TaxID=166485 RepID=UPI00253F6D8A|nr:dihydrofolate reductase [Caminicella sporogenes]WIF94904.1 dihydrofolate reductase [Caminicella sporogenes]
MNISIIAAMDKNGLIGKNGVLPWHLPKDLEYFKKVTTGHIVIMGRKTYESLGKPLQKRRNIVLTNNKSFKADGVEIVYSVEEALSKIYKKDEEVFIIGGKKIYEQFISVSNKLYITKIEYEFKGDTYFPYIDYNDWELVSIKRGILDELNPYKYYYYIYKRRKWSDNNG